MTTAMAAADPDELDRLTQGLIPVATDLVCRVRDEGRESVGALLESLTDRQRWALLVVLAAMVPDDRPVRELLAWVDGEEHQPPARIPRPEPVPIRRPRPCGTHAAFVRHKMHGEQPCSACWEAERAYQRERAGARRRTARAIANELRGEVA